MENYQTSLIVCSAIMMSFGLFAAIMAFVTLPEQKEYRSIFFVIAIVLVVLSATLYPINVEEHQDVVIIKEVGEKISDNFVYFELCGQTHRMAIDEEDRNMFKLLVGHEVELTYGKLYTIFGGTNYWEFVDVKVP